MRVRILITDEDGQAHEIAVPLREQRPEAVEDALCALRALMRLLYVVEDIDEYRDALSIGTAP